MTDMVKPRHPTVAELNNLAVKIDQRFHLLQLPNIEAAALIGRMGLVEMDLLRIQPSDVSEYSRFYFEAEFQATLSDSYDGQGLSFGLHTHRRRLFFIQRIRSFNDENPNREHFVPEIPMDQIPWINDIVKAAGDYLNGQLTDCGLRCISIRAMRHGVELKSWSFKDPTVFELGMLFHKSQQEQNEG